MKTEIFYKVIINENVKYISLKSESSFSVAEGLAKLKNKYQGKFVKIRPATKNELIIFNLKAKGIMLKDIHESPFFKDFKKAIKKLRYMDRKPMLALAIKYGL